MRLSPHVQKCVGSVGPAGPWQMRWLVASAALVEIRDAQQPGKTSSLGMSVMVSPEEVGLGISPVGIIPSSKCLNRTKGESRVNLLPLLPPSPSHTSVACVS